MRSPSISGEEAEGVGLWVLWGGLRTAGQKLDFLWRSESWREEESECFVKEPKCPERGGSSSASRLWSRPVPLAQLNFQGPMLPTFLRPWRSQALRVRAELQVMVVKWVRGDTLFQTERSQSVATMPPANSGCAGKRVGRDSEYRLWAHCGITSPQPHYEGAQEQWPAHGINGGMK